MPVAIDPVVLRCMFIRGLKLSKLFQAASNASLRPGTGVLSKVKSALTGRTEEMIAGNNAQNEDKKITFL